MVTRLEKSSKLRTPEYMLLYRLEQVLGPRVINRALAGDERALQRIEDFAWRGRKKPALVRWVKSQRERSNNGSGCKEI
jgi:hypothetical protein